VWQFPTPGHALHGLRVDTSEKAGSLSVIQQRFQVFHDPQSLDFSASFTLKCLKVLKMPESAQPYAKIPKFD
jgi:hypothetical protein